MLFFLLFTFQSHANLCAERPVNTLEYQFSEIVQNTICESCPFQDEKTELIKTLEFSSSNADETIQDILQTLEQQIALRPSHYPKCPSPCKAKHKSIPLLKVSPQEIHPTIRCEEQYLKTHVFKKKFTATGKAAECKKEVNDQASKWTEKTLVGPSFFLLASTPEGDELWDQCPSSCSYYSTQILDVTHSASGCEMNFTLEVVCGHKKKDSNFIAKGYIRDNFNCHH